MTWSTHPCVVATSGNVFAYEAIQELNIRPKLWTDLVSGQAFTKGDIITIQDPSRPPKLIIRPEDAPDAAAAPEPETEFTGKRLPKRKRLDDVAQAAPAKVAAAAAAKKPSVPAIPTHHFTTGATSSSFTSTAAPLSTSTTLERLNDAELRARRYAKLKGTDAKGYVRLVTTKGQLNFQLDCALAPFACHNFILLCQRGYYNGVQFHRLIPNFMVQGGDPTGTGTGGESAWGVPFRDECRPELRHDSRGILSMANAGPDSNKSQFFVTLRPTPHLNGKHTVFGRLVGGEETLDAIGTLCVSCANARDAYVLLQRRSPQIKTIGLWQRSRSSALKCSWTRSRRSWKDRKTVL